MNFLSLYGIIHSLYTPTHTRLSDIIRFIVNRKKRKRKKFRLTDSFFDRTTLRPTDPFLSLLHGISIKNLTIAQTSKNAGFWSIRSARIRIAVHSVAEVVFDQGYPSTTGVQKGSILLLPGLTSHLEQDVIRMCISGRLVFLGC